MYDTQQITSTADAAMTNAANLDQSSQRLVGSNYAEQANNLRPDPPKVVHKELPTDLHVAVVEASTSDTNIQTASGEEVKSLGGFRKDIEYRLAFSVSTLERIGRASSFQVPGVVEVGPATPTGKKGDGYIHFSDGKAVEPGGAVVTQDIARWVEPADPKTPQKKPAVQASPKNLYVTASNNGMLCLLRLARALAASKDAMGAFGDRMKFHTAMEVSLPRDGSKGDARKQNFYAGSLPVCYNSAAVNGTWSICAALMTAAGQGKNVQPSAREGFAYQGLTDVAAIAAKLDTRINAFLKPDNGMEQHTYVNPGLPIAELFMQYEARLKEPYPDLEAIATEMLLAWKVMVKENLSVDWMPDRHQDFKDQFIGTLETSAESYWSGVDSPSKVIADLKRKHSLKGTSREDNRVRLDEHNNQESGFK